MYPAKVIGKVTSIIKHPIYDGKSLLLIQPIDLKYNPKGKATIAVDYVGAGEGDIVLIGNAPGQAKEVFNVDNAPIRELVMAIIDRIDVASNQTSEISEISEV